MPITPWTHDSPFVPGTTVRADSANFKLDGIAVCLNQMALRLNQKTPELPATFTGSVSIPEKSVANTILYINSAGNMDVFSKSGFDSDVATTAVLAQQVASHTLSAANSASLAYNYMLLAQQTAAEVVGGLYFAGGFDAAAGYPVTPTPDQGACMWVAQSINVTLDIRIGDYVFYDQINSIWRHIPGRQRLSEIELFGLGGTML